MGMRIGYLYAVPAGKAPSLGIAWYGPLGAARRRSQSYRAADGRSVADAAAWAADDWCAYMENEGHAGSILFVDPAAVPAKATERVHGQYVVYGIDGTAMDAASSPVRPLADLARREACRMPHAVRAVLADAYSAYGQYMPVGGRDVLEEKWPDLPGPVQAAVSDACAALDAAWADDRARNAYDAAIGLSGAVQRALGTNAQ